MKRIMTGLSVMGLLAGAAFAQIPGKKVTFNVSGGLLGGIGGSGLLIMLGVGSDITMGKHVTLSPEIQMWTYQFQFGTVLLTPGLLLNYSPNKKIFFGGGVAYPFLVGGDDEDFGFFSSALNVGYRTGHFVFRVFYLSPFVEWLSHSLIGGTISYRF
jgi:hypothetical protein